MNAGTFAKILDLGAQVLPHDDLVAEVEYEDCAITQSPISSAVVNGEYIVLQLGEKHTDCLAKELCGINGEGCGKPESANVSTRAGCC